MRSILLCISICNILFKNIVSFADCCIEIQNVEQSKDSNNNISQVEEMQSQKNYDENIQIEKDKEFFDGCQDLINKYCQKKKINFEKNDTIYEDIKDSSCGCKKITIEDNGKKHVFFIKENDPINTYYIDILKQIGLCNLDYISNDKYLLTSEIDLSETKKFNNFNIDKDNNFDEKVLNKINDIKNFKEFCFFCALLELTDCNPLYKLDNCYIVNNHLMLLDINRNKNSHHRKRTDSNQSYSFFNSYKEKKYFYSTLLQNTYFLFSDIFDKIYLDYEDDLDLNIAALMFIINQYCEKSFFVEKESLVDSKESDIIKFLNIKGYGKDLKMLIKTPSIISKNKNYWSEVLGTKCKLINVKKELRKLFLENFKDNLFETFVKYICKKIWEMQYKKKKKFYGSDYEIFFGKVKNNLEKCKDIIKALKKYFDSEIFLKNEKFKKVILSEDFTQEEKDNIVNKLNIILNYLQRNILDPLKKDIYKKITRDLVYRLQAIRQAYLFNFLFENEKISAIVEHIV